MTLTLGVDNRHVVNMKEKYIDPKNTFNINKPKVLKDKLKNVDFEQGKKEFIEFLEEEKYDIEVEYRPLALLLLFDVVRRNDILNAYISDDIKNIGTKKNWIYKDKGKWFYLANKYKTVKRYGPQLFEITNKHFVNYLEVIVQGSNKRKIINRDTTTIWRWLKDTTDEFFGVEMTVQDLRVLDSTNDVFNLSLNEQQLLYKARKAGHSLSIRLSRYARPV
jgi:hypothetical protein